MARRRTLLVSGGNIFGRLRHRRGPASRIHLSTGRVGSQPGSAQRDEAGIPMVYVSHDAAELRQLATQIVMLKGGRITAFGGVKVLTPTSQP